MDIKKICVVGGGLMGRQIALNAAIHGVDATVNDMKAEVCDDVAAWAEDYLAGRVKKGRMTEEQIADIKTRFHVEKDLARLLKGLTAWWKRSRRSRRSSGPSSPS